MSHAAGSTNCLEHVMEIIQRHHYPLINGLSNSEKIVRLNKKFQCDSVRKIGLGQGYHLKK